MPEHFTTSLIALGFLWLLNFLQLYMRSGTTISSNSSSIRSDESSSSAFHNIRHQYLMGGFQPGRTLIQKQHNISSFREDDAIHDQWNERELVLQNAQLTSGGVHVRGMEKDKVTWKNQRSDIDLDKHQRFPREISSLQDLLKMNTTIARPTNLHIAFAGDSLTRYQYLSLAHFLKYGAWIDPDEIPNMTQEKQHNTWHEFYKFTKSKLHPYEECDCFRPEGHKMALMMENRYFFDPVRNNSISYFQKFGHKFSFKSNWNVTDVHHPHELITKEHQLKFELETQSWPRFIKDFVSKMDPKPTFFIFNEGIHPHRDLTNKKVRRQILRAIRESGMIGVYKTTTKYRLHNITNNNITETHMIRDYELDFCKKIDLCLDLSWTWHVPVDYYSDYAHFREPVYTWQNVQLMELLGLDKRYYKEMRQHFHGMESQVDLSFV